MQLQIIIIIFLPLHFFCYPALTNSTNTLFQNISKSLQNISKPSCIVSSIHYSTQTSPCRCLSLSRRCSGFFVHELQDIEVFKLNYNIQPPPSLPSPLRRLEYEPFLHVGLYADLDMNLCFTWVRSDFCNNSL